MPNAKSFIIYMAKYYAKTGYTEGKNNWNQFSDIVNRYGLKGYQNAAWCATYQFALELMAFGKAEALRHWNMTARDYCGMSVFDTEKRFISARKTSTTPQIGALVIFKRSHMGRVISLNKSKKTFECAEGNSSDKCVVKTYSWTDASIKSFCIIDYGHDLLTPEKILGALNAVYEMAHNLGWVYSDSQTIPPCVIDKRVACDRLEALACFILGYTDQQAGGFVTSNMERILTSWGWKVIKDQSKLIRSDFALFYKDGQSTATWEAHAFALTYYKSASNVGKFDLGSDDRIKAAQPYRNVPIDQWENRHFYAGFRAPFDSHVIESAVNRAYCIDVKGASESNRANVQCYKKNGTTAQDFILEPVGSYYTITNVKSGMVLDVSGAKVENKRNVWQYTKNGTKAQLWKMLKNSDGSVTFESALNEGYALDLSGAIARNGRNIYLYKKNGTAAQKWFLN